MCFCANFECESNRFAVLELRPVNGLYCRAMLYELGPSNNRFSLSLRNVSSLFSEMSVYINSHRSLFIDIS
jgi:hypothetical protein